MPISAKIVQEIATKYNLPMMKVKQAIEDLGHTNGEKISGYINSMGLAVKYLIRDKMSDQMRGMMPEERKTFDISRWK